MECRCKKAGRRERRYTILLTIIIARYEYAITVVEAAGPQLAKIYAKQVKI